MRAQQRVIGTVASVVGMPLRDLGHGELRHWRARVGREVRQRRLIVPSGAVVDLGRRDVSVCQLDKGERHFRTSHQTRVEGDEVEGFGSVMPAARMPDRIASATASGLMDEMLSAVPSWLSPPKPPNHEPP